VKNRATASDEDGEEAKTGVKRALYDELKKAGGHTLVLGVKKGLQRHFCYSPILRSL